MSDDPLRELGKQLPWHRPDDERRESVRSSLLVAATEGAHPTARRRWLLVGGGFAMGALAAAAVAIMVVHPGRDAAETPRTVYAQIERSSAAELEHTRTPTPTGTDERVRVRAGTVRLAVPSVRNGDRVRVQTADAEVEGSGSYEVVVAGDALTSVAVTAGTASVKLTGQIQTVFLAAGQKWRAPVVTAELEIGKQAPPPETATGAAPMTAPAAAAATAATPQNRVTTPNPARGHPVKSPAPAKIEASDTQQPVRAPRPAVTEFAGGDAAPIAPKRQPSPAEQHFRAGWALLRAGKAVEAAAELGVSADTGDEPLASDARYFQAVALVKAGRRLDAERAFVAFLDHAPKSVRRGRAAVMLGRLLVDRGDRKTARAWLDAATRDSDPAVAAAARAGLELLAH